MLLSNGRVQQREDAPANTFVPSRTKGPQADVVLPWARNKSLGLERQGGIFLCAEQLKNLSLRRTAERRQPTTLPRPWEEATSALKWNQGLGTKRPTVNYSCVLSCDHTITYSTTRVISPMGFTLRYQDLFHFSTCTEGKKQIRKWNAFLISSWSISYVTHTLKIASSQVLGMLFPGSL